MNRQDFREDSMPKLTTCAAAAVAVALASVSAQAQTPPPTMAPSAQNSGTGIPGLPGSESGSAVRPGAESAAPQSSADQNTTVQQQDSAKVPGFAGNKNGPPARAPSSSSAAQSTPNASTAQSPPGGSASAPAQNQGQPAAKVSEQIKMNLQNAGFTDIKVMPSSFIVRARDRDGHPVMMVINPDSVTEITATGLGTGTTGQSSSSKQQDGIPSDAQK